MLSPGIPGERAQRLSVRVAHGIIANQGTYAPVALDGMPRLAAVPWAHAGIGAPSGLRDRPSVERLRFFDCLDSVLIFVLLGALCLRVAHALDGVSRVRVNALIFLSRPYYSPSFFAESRIVVSSLTQVPAAGRCFTVVQFRSTSSSRP